MRGGKDLPLLRLRPGRALNHLARSAGGALGQRREPARRDPAVVVRERDELAARCAPADVPLPGRAAGPRVDRPVAQRPVGRERVIVEHARGGAGVVVVHDDQLPPLARQGLLLERVQQPAQPQVPCMRGDDDADGDRAAHVAVNLIFAPCGY
jgi:hypothetical protein